MKSLRDTPRREQLEEAMKLLSQESDRGCALVGGALLDEHLRDYLAAYFETDAITTALLDAQNAPLFTFSSRIKLAHAIGIIDADWFHGFEVVRRIRNAAAHFERKHGFNTGFQTEPIKNRCLELIGSSTEALALFKDRPRHVFSLYVAYSAGALIELSHAMRFIRKQPSDSMDMLMLVRSLAVELSKGRNMSGRVAARLLEREDARLVEPGTSAT